ncbi:MAG: methyltransferase domain-containing protein [Planctomycetes bacterium]|nr:methyltransferase domain-containing protein [Planctomycetota bacterium]
MADMSLPEFLASLGKTELKPGGTYATGALIRLLELRGGDHALVCGPNAGSTALFVSMTTQATTEALVREESEKVTENDPSLKRRSTARIGKAEALPFPDGHFHAAMVEASLSYMHPLQQAAALKELHRVLKPGGRIGIHELCWRQPPTPELEQALQSLWRGPVAPMVVRGWWDRLEDAGFHELQNELAVVSYFTRKGLQADEEAEVTAQIFHSAFEDADKLARFSAAYREFTDNRRYYGVIIARGVK